MTSDTEKSKLVALSIMAQGQIDRLQSYLARGRQYEGFSLDRLAQVWLTAARAWGANPFEPSVAMDDAAMEYGLRDLDPPWDLAKDDIERGLAAVGARADQMTDEERRQANARMVADHKQSTRSKN